MKMIRIQLLIHQQTMLIRILELKMNKLMAVITCVQTATDGDDDANNWLSRASSAHGSKMHTLEDW
jgi:hypothetical protein